MINTKSTVKVIQDQSLKGNMTRELLRLRRVLTHFKHRQKRWLEYARDQKTLVTIERRYNTQCKLVDQPLTCRIESSASFGAETRHRIVLKCSC